MRSANKVKTLKLFPNPLTITFLNIKNIYSFRSMRILVIVTAKKKVSYYRKKIAVILTIRFE